YLRGRDGILKPDIVAPGRWHTAPAAEHGQDPVLHESGKYEAMNGTSAATPYTAGVIALLFQKKPDLSTKDLRQLFKAATEKDDYTGKLPNERWGNGKLNKKAVEKL